MAWRVLIVKQPRILTLLHHDEPIYSFPVAIGKPVTPTPTGNYTINSKVNNPGGILGTRWLGLNYDAYGIHGTNRPWLIGQMVSNGCIRLHNEHIETIFPLVGIGTPVTIREK